MPSLEEFTRDALSGELGITVPARAGLTFGKQRDDDGVSDPEIKDADYDALVFFMKSLAPPPRKPIDSARAAAGAALFARIGCQRCHVPELRTADGTPVPLYSDLLLHDVMAVGALGVPSGAASGRELRTPPLWGLSGSAPYMHDGRAATIEQAIERHDGEGRAARAAFRELDSAARATLLEFLGSL